MKSIKNITTTVYGHPLPGSGRRCDACSDRHVKCHKKLPDEDCRWCRNNGKSCTYWRLKERKSRKQGQWQGMSVFQVSKSCASGQVKTRGGAKDNKVYLMTPEGRDDPTLISLGEETTEKYVHIIDLKGPRKPVRKKPRKPVSFSSSIHLFSVNPMRNMIPKSPLSRISRTTTQNSFQSSSYPYDEVDDYYRSPYPERQASTYHTAPTPPEIESTQQVVIQPPTVTQIGRPDPESDTDSSDSSHSQSSTVSSSLTMAEPVRIFSPVPRKPYVDISHLHLLAGGYGASTEHANENHVNHESDAPFNGVAMTPFHSRPPRPLRYCPASFGLQLKELQSLIYLDSATSRPFSDFAMDVDLAYPPGLPDPSAGLGVPMMGLSMLSGPVLNHTMNYYSQYLQHETAGIAIEGVDLNLHYSYDSFAQL
ncbi:hypothetical protein D9758_001455 [Tetrapyrgos nigripes]|uniref:Zn(2)-C6 fungal-type domain-containing protein n=1 Tax=Tetrapyrgos nigripes TaxID=182062 RepID=A0A8H5GXF8_9AGAR|nr:hypothetical protein D9758_001455 [Tetrapyrgos nigripes]